MSRWLPILTLFALVALPELASACAVCGASLDDDQTRVAYLVTSAVLSVLPLALLGGFLLWLRAKSRRQNGIEPPPHPPT